MSCYFLKLFLLLLSLSASLTASQHDDGKCVKLAVPLCGDLQYNLTLMPNHMMAVDDMAEASRRISEFSPLFKVDCYANFKFFVCNMFLPICHDFNGRATPVFPCRHVCELARQGCEPLMQRYSFQWPEILSCDRLIRFEDMQNDPSQVCGSPPVNVSTRRPGPPIPTRRQETTTLPNWVEALEQFPDPNLIIKQLRSLKPQPGIDPMKDFSLKQFCEYSPRFVYIKKDKSKELCLPMCNVDIMFTKDDKKFAGVWISTWSIICFMSTLLTVSTFLIDHKRFRYPERPIIFLSFCYNLYSIGYLIRVFGGYESVVCEESSNGRHISHDGMSVTSCTLVFFFLYFFGMASAIWWVVLSLTWFLSAALKWGHEAIEKYASIFHAVSWAVPTIQTIIALVSRKIDGDRLSGLCYVGNASSKNLLLFVVVPLTIYLVIGTLFLFLGFLALVRIRKVLRRQRNTTKLERLMVRIGIFSVLYSVPASVVVGCFIHEYLRLKTSEEVSLLQECGTDPKCMRKFLPKPEIFYLRYFMLLVVGVTSGVWIWSSKTLQSWSRFYRRCCGNGDIDSDTHDEKKQLYQKQQSVSGNNQHMAPIVHQTYVRSNSRDDSSQVAKILPSLHGSQTHVHQQPIYVPPPTRFYFPVQQHTPGYIQAQNIALPKVLDENFSSRGYAVTPISTITSSTSHNHDHMVSLTDTMTNVSNPAPPSSNYSRSIHSSLSGSVHQNGHVQRPGSPRGSSSSNSRSLSHRSGQEVNL